MKYSFMTFSTPDLSLDEALSMAERFGYEGIEPRIGAGHSHGIEVTASPAERTAARGNAVRRGLAFSCIATSCIFANRETHAENLEFLRGAIDLAGDIGCQRVRVFGGELPTGVSRSEAMDLVVDGLSSAADQAAERGVIICMETHDGWCDPRHVAEVMRRVDHRAVAVNWDIMHTFRTARMSADESWDILRQWVHHIHFHDGTDGSDFAMLPIGEGAIDHRRPVELLMSSGYSDFLSGEWINWEPAEIHLPRELAAVKRYEVPSI